MSDPRAARRRAMLGKDKAAAVPTAPSVCQCLAADHEHPAFTPCGGVSVAQIWTVFGTFLVCAECETALTGTTKHGALVPVPEKGGES